MLKARLDIAEHKLYELRKILIHPSLSKKFKLRLIKSTIVPIAIYGCESWDFLNKAETHKGFNKLNRIIFRYLSKNPANFRFRLEDKDLLLQNAAKKRRDKFLEDLKESNKNISEISLALYARHNNFVQPQYGIHYNQVPFKGIRGRKRKR